MLDYAIRSGLLLALTFLAGRMLRDRSAAWRHLVLLAGLTSLLALPGARFVAPHWNAPGLVESLGLPAPVRTVIEVTAAAEHRNPRAKDPVDWLFAVWLGGAALLAIRLMRAQILARRLVRKASPGREEDTVISNETDIPMVCGLWHPVVVLPMSSQSWPAEQLESVLRHERMHIARRDTVSQALAQLACALYWPQPLVWLAASALRKSCEQACDDGVLSQGTRPSAYAGHLMEIARALPQRHSAGVTYEGGIAMTGTNQLEQRIAALLNPGRDRRQAGASFAAAVAAVSVAAVIGLAAIQMPLFAQSGKLAGVVHDPSGAVVPRARVDVRTSVAAGAKAPSAVHEVVYSNQNGEFSLDNLPDGTYDITVTSPGFARQEQQAVLFESATAKPMNMTLAIGGIKERVNVQAAQSADLMAKKMRDEASATAASGGLPPQRIRVGGNVQAANLIRKVTPLYPVTAKQDGVEGTVIMKAVIGKDGSILSLEQVNKQVDSRLADAAMEAVKQWMYRPTLLNGEPVEVVTEIEVNFTLMR